MRRLAFPRALPLLVAAVALALGGCDSATEGAGPATPRGSSPGPEDDVTRWVEAAKITPDPGALLHDTTGGPGPTTACDAVTAAGAQVGYAHTWWWADGETSYLEHFVGVYDLPGADIIDLHERRSNECPSLQYRYQGGAAESTVSQTLADPEVAGSDGSYAYCEKSVTLEPAEHRGEESRPAMPCSAAAAS
jgi:hypothetical protein